MHTTLSHNHIALRRKNEQGAALLTTLLISMLLLAAGGALIVSTSLTTTNTYDSTAEAQAYYAAETGLQATLNVLRKHATSISPNNLTMDFRKAVTINTSYTSNRSGDPSGNTATGTGVARLSNWLPYSDYTDVNSRVVVNAGAPYCAYSISVSDPDNTPVANLPSRLLIISKGYGPKGATKQLKLFVSRVSFAFDAPSTITMVGAADPVADPMHLTLGQSNAKEYSGHDHTAGGATKPAIGTTSASDLTIATNSDTKNTVEAPKAANISASLPSWLQSADSARAFLSGMQSLADSQGRLFPSFSGTSGSVAAPAFTFVNGDCTLDGGAGLLIVTGNLELSGNPSFNGIILVLGGGTVNRNGGGNGDIYGAMVVAQFARTWPVAEDRLPHPFTSPWFDTSGGGNSNMQYDSTSVNNALGTAGNIPLGVLEY